MIIRGLLVAVVLAAAGCEQQDAIAPAPPPLTPSPERSPWRTIGGSARVAVAPAEPFQELADAMAQARSTAADARRRWALEPEPATARARWAVKWAAPTIDGGVEHVWVRPTSWSRHRIEGWLTNSPQGTLECGRGQGDLVSFSAEELSDWVHFAAGANADPIEGGFTKPVLEARYGRPR